LRWQKINVLDRAVGFFFQLAGNGFVYEKLRFCVRGFSEGKSDVTKLQLTLFKH